MDSAIPKRPALRYHGGKWLLAPWIISHFPAHKIYVEPYGGAASVLLRKPRSYDEVYNEFDGEVSNLFSVLRQPDLAARLTSALELTPFSRKEFEAAYDLTDDSVENARRLIVRGYMGFGSASFNRDYSTGFRAYSKQTGRTPSKDWDNFPSALRAVAERFKGVTIENRPALQVIGYQDSPDTLFYVDPPYYQATRPNSNHKQYRFEMTERDHVALAILLNTCTGKVIVSGYRHDLYDELYEGWRRVKKKAFAGGNEGRVARTEHLWMNF